MAFHHVAVATRDLEGSHRFYTEAMGFELVKVVTGKTPEGGWSKHAFYETGGDGLMALWELHDDSLAEGWSPAISTGLGLPVWVNHLAFDARDATTLDTAKQRWLGCGHDVMEVDHGFCVSLYTRDPNGIMVEWCLTTRDFTDADREEARRRLADAAPEFESEPATRVYRARDYAPTRPGDPVSLSVDVFWSFRSPYSYLVTPRLVDLARDYDVVVDLRPVYPLAIRQADFFDRVNPLWPGYLMRDTQRVAESLGLPFRWPRPDPVVQSLEAGRLRTAAEQPYIHRLTRLGVAAGEQGRGLAFADEASKLIFGGVENWHEGSRLAEAASRAGLDLAALDAAVDQAPERYDARIEQNQKDHAAAGHWGVPTMVFQGEPFFGQDRFALLVWRLQQAGLERRTS